MTPDQVKAGLVSLGWRIRNQTDHKKAVEDFQRGWNLGSALKIDGLAGPETQKALTLSLSRAKRKQGTASRSFSFAEFACKCGGKYATCRRIRVHRGLLVSLESYRDRLGQAVEIVSGYRCPSHNDAVDGATNSQHLYGAAADIRPLVNWQTLRDWRLFAGIGYKRSSKLVSHVDRRDVSGNNTTGSTKDRPQTWVYSS